MLYSPLLLISLQPVPNTSVTCSRPPSRWRRWLPRLFGAAGLVLAAAAVVSLLTGGIHLHLGSLTLSATQPARLLVEAFVLFIFAQLLAGLCSAESNEATRSRGAAIRTFLRVFGLLVSLALDSTPRRIGDGGEYMLMAFQVAHGRPPALLDADVAAFNNALPSGDSFRDLPVSRHDLAGRDGRFDFVHFWFYPLLAAPLLRVAMALGAHPNFGFTALNLLLWAAAGLVLARRVSPALLTLILAGPVFWWLDKAHTELLSAAALTIAVISIDDEPWWAVLALGIGGTQNPALAIGAVVFVVYALSRGAWRDRRFRIALAVAGLVCALHPAYYLWHLGRLSPMESVVTREVPGVTALLTPVIDPNLGVFVYTPAVALLAVVGLVACARRPRIVLAKGAVWAAAIAGAIFLFAFAQTPNVNHGGTFNPSRYGLWLIPLTIPLLRAGEEHLGKLRPYLMTGLALFASAWCCYMFSPRWPEHASDPTTLARLLSTYAPAWYNPLPEVFTERLAGGETPQPLPLATRGCTKVLLAGDGTARPPWPIPCVPQDVPVECRPAGALCYANGHPGAYVFARAPRQTGFAYEQAGGWTWKQTTDPRLRSIVERAGTGGLEPWPPQTPSSFLVDAICLRKAHVWQGAGGLVAWMTPDPRTRLRVRVPQPGTAQWIDQASGEEVGQSNLMPASDTWLSPPNVAAPVLVIALSRGTRH